MSSSFQGVLQWFGSKTSFGASPANKVVYPVTSWTSVGSVGQPKTCRSTFLVDCFVTWTPSSLIQTLWSSLHFKNRYIWHIPHTGIFFALIIRKLTLYSAQLEIYFKNLQYIVLTFYFLLKTLCFCGIYFFSDLFVMQQNIKANLWKPTYLKTEFWFDFYFATNDKMIAEF